jgi:glucokinase
VQIEPKVKNGKVSGTREPPRFNDGIFFHRSGPGGTNLRVAAYRKQTGIVDSVLLPTRPSHGRDQVVRDMCDAIRTLTVRNEGTLTGIGIGSPGPLELPEGILRNPPNLHGWDGFRLRAVIEAELGRTVALESDANLAAFAEWKLGAGLKYGIDSLCVLTLGTGVGSGLILNGAVWSGFNGTGGEAGHIIVQEDGAACGCGGHGRLEQYASAKAVVRMAHERLAEAATDNAHELALLARNGNPRAQEVFDTVGYSLAIALTALINTLNLPLYLLGGGVCDAWDLFAPTMFQHLHSRSYVYRLTEPTVIAPGQLEVKRTYVLPAELGSTAGLLNACLLGLEESSRIAPSRSNQYVSECR